jgi:DNA-binding NarL/FixJ family response regulator
MSLPANVARRATVLVADDRPETLAQLVELLSPHFEVLATVPDGLALVTTAACVAPDVILTDISMPGLDGIEAARRIRLDRPSARIVFVTVHDEDALVDRCLGTGALGYVLKDAAGDDLVAAVEAALRGERYISGDLHWRDGES